jgi:ribonucleotide reductase beta subunit family protein with ferritin-like domain
MFNPANELNLERLKQLTNIAYKNQWAPDDQINWDEDIIIPTGISKNTYIDMVSQLYYAEEATIRLLGEMLIKVPDLQAKQYLCTQAMDEARHADVYKRYLEKLGDIAPMNSALKSVFEAGFNSNHSYHRLVVALNIVMEGEALNQQYKRIETLPCPLFVQINKSIVRDESRHAAFGKIYMREKVKELSSNEKAEIFEWIKTLWFLWNKANQGRYTIEGSEILQTNMDELDERWQYQLKTFKELGFFDS